MTTQTPPLWQRNVKAWDALYGNTTDLVWGTAPVGFLDPFLDDLRLHVTPRSRILDAATGEGRNLPVLLSLGGQVTACDASQNALRKIAAPVRDQIEAVLCDLYDMIFESDTFDLILASDIIETLPEPERGLREMFRVLKPGGLLLCNIPGMDDTIAGIDMSEVHDDHDRANGNGNGNGHHHHHHHHDDHEFLYRDQYFFRFMSEDDAVAMLTSLGFVVVRNEICQWVEHAHPEFRDGDHVHVSRVFLVKKPD